MIIEGPGKYPNGVPLTAEEFLLFGAEKRLSYNLPGGLSAWG